MAKKKPESSFEDILQRLEEITQRLESGESKLEESLGLFEEGVRLVKHGNGQLDAADQRLEVLREGGSVESLPVDASAAAAEQVAGDTKKLKDKGSRDEIPF